MKVTKSLNLKEKGFTLIELLLVIAILTIAVGVTGDIVLSLVKSYNKTQVGNEIQQNATFVLAKLEKELRNASSIVPPVTANQIVFLDKDQNQITYKVVSYNGSYHAFRKFGTSGSDVLLTNDNAVSGVKLSDCSLNPCFAHTNSPTTTPYVIKLRFDFSQAGSPTGTSLTGDVVVENTIVLRGTY